MQIVEYLYATLFGNDLHAGSNFSRRRSRSRIPEYRVLPNRRTEENLSAVYIRYLSLNGNSSRQRGTL